MHISLAVFSLFTSLALAAPFGAIQQLDARQGGVSDNCGGKSYSAAQVNQAIKNALSGKYDSSGYPHTYNVSLFREAAETIMRANTMSCARRFTNHRTMRVGTTWNIPLLHRQLTHMSCFTQALISASTAMDHMLNIP